MTERPTGLTEGAGWEVGVSRTLRVDVVTAWDFLVSPAGVSLWLGDDVSMPLEKGLTYRTADGTSGEVRSLRPHDRVRLTWRPPGRDSDAILQVALAAAAPGCVVRFHSERLVDSGDREAMRTHFRETLDRLQDALEPSPT
jgi:uncharacterized protein YndB with AHSA1/START domain